jgi:hypothetical protein
MLWPRKISRTSTSQSRAFWRCSSRSGADILDGNRDSYIRKSLVTAGNHQQKSEITNRIFRPLQSHNREQRQAVSSVDVKPMALVAQTFQPLVLSCCYLLRHGAIYNWYKPKPVTQRPDCTSDKLACTDHRHRCRDGGGLQKCNHRAG